MHRPKSPILFLSGRTEPTAGALMRHGPTAGRRHRRRTTHWPRRPELADDANAGPSPTNPLGASDTEPPVAAGDEARAIHCMTRLQRPVQRSTINRERSGVRGSDRGFRSRRTQFDPSYPDSRSLPPRTRHWRVPACRDGRRLCTPESTTEGAIVSSNTPGWWGPTIATDIHASPTSGTWPEESPSLRYTL